MIELLFIKKLLLFTDYYILFSLWRASDLSPDNYLGLPYGAVNLNLNKVNQNFLNFKRKNFWNKVHIYNFSEENQIGISINMKIR
jgi:hypothetical protein